jgi:hypothetical protein
MDFKELSVEEIEKLSKEDQDKYFAAKAENQRAEIIKDFENKIDEKTKDFLNKSEIDQIKEDFTKSISEMPIEALNKYVDTIEGIKKDVKTVEDLANEVKEITKEQGTFLAKMKEGVTQIQDVRRKANRKTHMEELIKRAFLSEEFDSFKSRGFTGASQKMVLDQEGKEVQLKRLGGKKGDESSTIKATVSVTNDHTGTVLISEVSDIVRDDTLTRVSHVRDLLNVSMTDQAQIVAGQVYDYTDALTLGAVMLADTPATKSM